MKKSFMTRVLAVTLSAAMAFSLSSATSLTAPEAAAKKLPANKKAASISLKVGKSKTLKLKSYKKWNIKSAKSNKTKVATVKSTGKKAKRTVKVTAVKKGTAKVTLKLGKRAKANGKSTKYTKTIKKVVTVKVTKAKTTTPTDTTPTDTTPTDTTPTDTTTNTTPGALSITEVKAAKVDTLEVTFASPVASTADVKFTLARGTQNIDLKSDIAWNAEATVATIETVAKMTKGTYTLTATNGTETATGTVEIEDQKVNEIKFLNDVALTGGNPEATEAYVYYDVLDQYGESMRETVSITWTSSTGNCDSTKRSQGKLVLTKKDEQKKNQPFTYGDKIYLTGVYTKTGVSASGTFTIGTTQSIDSVKFVGFLKKGTTTFTEKLPAGFKYKEYQLLYTPLDQNGCELDAENFVPKTEGTTTTTTTTTSSKGGLTFISDNVLVVEKVEGNNPVTVGGKEYCAVTVVPGLNVNSGGTVNLSAISTKTGQKSTLNFVVGEYRILKKFTIGSPKSGVVADGEETELEFTATDKDGNAMTNFVELASQSDFSKLSFSAGTGTLYLDENDDGTAALKWCDWNENGQGSQDGRNYWNSESADGIDRPVSLTAIVVGGETDNQMLYVSDKARPEAIADVDLAEVMVTNSEQKISLSSFTFLDQYGRNMTATYRGFYRMNAGMDYQQDGYNTRAYDDGNTNKGYIYDNGFFYYINNKNGSLTGTDYENYKFGISAEASDYSDYAKNLTSDKATYANPFTGLLGQYNQHSGFQISYSGSTVKEPTIKFAIAKLKTNDANAKVELVSKQLTKTFQIVKLDNLTNFAVGDMDKWKITTLATPNDTGDVNGVVTAGGINNSATGANGTVFNVENSGDVKVSASYNGKSVDVPGSFLSIEADVLRAGTGSENNKIVSASGIAWKDLYDATTAHYNRKDATDTVKVTVKNLSGDNIVTVKKGAYISDEGSKATTFTCPDTLTLEPTSTVIDLSFTSKLNGDVRVVSATSLKVDKSVFTSGATGLEEITAEASAVKHLADQAADKIFVIKDQYGTTLFEYNDKTRVADYGKGTLDDKITVKTSNGNKDAVEFQYLVKDITENPDGYVMNNFSVKNNSSANTYITGAERGDKFTLEITVTDNRTGKTITKPILVTVGADTNSTIAGQYNNYAGVRGVLQAQLYNLYN